MGVYWLAKASFLFFVLRQSQHNPEFTEGLKFENLIRGEVIEMASASATWRCSRCEESNTNRKICRVCGQKFKHNCKKGKGVGRKNGGQYQHRGLIF